MCCISLGRKEFVKPVEHSYDANGAPVIIDGIDILNTLCPVSQKSGMRENLLSLIRKLVNDPAKQALLYQCISELPVDNSQASLDENSKFELCPQRLLTGTPAENEEMLKIYSDVLDLKLESDKSAAVQQGISFEGGAQALVNVGSE